MGQLGGVKKSQSPWEHLICGGGVGSLLGAIFIEGHTGFG